MPPGPSDKSSQHTCTHMRSLGQYFNMAPSSPHLLLTPTLQFIKRPACHPLSIPLPPLRPHPPHQTRWLWGKKKTFVSNRVLLLSVYLYCYPTPNLLNTHTHNWSLLVRVRKGAIEREREREWGGEACEPAQLWLSPLPSNNHDLHALPVRPLLLPATERGVGERERY